MDIVTLAQPALIKLFLSKRVGEKVGLHIVGRVQSISKDSLSISIDMVTVGNTFLSFTEAAAEAKEELTRLDTLPSAG
jgi:hypothetical protein